MHNISFLFCFRCLYIPRTNRSDWDDLTREVVRLLRQLVKVSSMSSQVLVCPHHRLHISLL